MRFQNKKFAGLILSVLTFAFVMFVGGAGNKAYAADSLPKNAYVECEQDSLGRIHLKPVNGSRIVNIVLNTKAFGDEFAKNPEIMFSASFDTIEMLRINSEFEYKVYVPSTIEKIDAYAFDGDIKLKEIIFYTTPEANLKTIGDYAFRACESLEELVFPDSIKKIGNNVFAGCSGLKKLEITGNIDTFAANDFTEFNNLETVVLPEGLMTVPERMFYHCDNLKKITIPSSVIAIGNDAFSNCIKLGAKINNEDNPIYLNGNIVSIGDRAFYQCESLEKVVVGDKLESIGKNAFEFCDKLNEFPYGINLTSIGKRAFSSCRSIKNVKIPAGLTSIPSEAFYNCQGLETVIFDNNSVLEEIGSNAFAGCIKIEEMVLPSEVVTVGENAFFGCTALKKLVLNNKLKNIGAEFINGCQSLTEITIPDSATGIDPQAFLYAHWLKKINMSYDIAEKINSSSIPRGAQLVYSGTCKHAQSIKNETDPTYKVAPTCTSSGEAYYECKVCKAKLTATYTVPAIGHLAVEGGRYIKSEANCTEPKVCYYECANCNAKLSETYTVGNPLGHTMEDVVKPATVKADGLITPKCSACGYEDGSKIIPMAFVVTDDSVKFTGKNVTPVKVKDANGKLISREFYTVTYKNNKAVGKATATVSFKGNYANVSGKPVKVSFYIVPAKMIPGNVSGLKVTGGKKELKVSWKALTKNADGYQIQYASDKNFTKDVKTVKILKAATKSKAIKKLKAKTPYYVRVRAFNKEGSLIAYSAKWTQLKKAVNTK